MEESRKRITLRLLFNTLKNSTGQYGYDIWLSDNVTDHTLLWHCAIEVLKSEPPPAYAPPTTGMRRVATFGGLGGFGENTREREVATELFPLACDILWLLCLRGVLRPGVRHAGGQSVDRGQGYSLTLRGREWVKGCSEENLQDLLAAL